MYYINNAFWLRATRLVTHPTRKEYEEMDVIRFPFMRRAIKVDCASYTPELKQRIKKLIREKQTFFDPIRGIEIDPIKDNVYYDG